MPNVVEPKIVSIVVPVYYNEESLEPLFDRLRVFEAALQQRRLRLELIFVDDGSGDGSLAALQRIRTARPETKIIKLTRNFGALAASKTGLRYATGDCVSILAADLQDPVEKVLEMVDCWRAGRKFVICVRANRDDPWTTKLFAALYYRIIRFLVIRDYPRGGFDLMLMDRDLLPHMLAIGPNTHPNLFAYWLGFEPQVLTYSRQKRQFGRSRWSFRKKVALFIDTLTGFSVAPIRMLAGFGFFVATASFLYGFYILIHALLGEIEVAGFATLVVLITFFSGLILVMLGVVGEYLWRIFDNSQNKPESIVEQADL